MVGVKFDRHHFQMTSAEWFNNVGGSWTSSTRKKYVRLLAELLPVSSRVRIAMRGLVAGKMLVTCAQEFVRSS
jgi:hypothetical protein